MDNSTFLALTFAPALVKEHNAYSNATVLVSPVFALFFSSASLVF